MAGVATRLRPPRPRTFPRAPSGRGPASVRRRVPAEALLVEVRVQAEVLVDPAGAHDGETDAVDETQPPAAGGKEGLEACVVLHLADPEWLDHGQQLTREHAHGLETEAGLHERDRLQQHVVGGHESCCVVQPAIPGGPDDRVAGIVGVEKGEERAGVDEDAHHSMESTK